MEKDTGQESRQVSVADELAKLADLGERGILSHEEFDSQKAKLLGSAPGAFPESLADADDRPGVHAPRRGSSPTAIEPKSHELSEASRVGVVSSRRCRHTSRGRASRHDTVRRDDSRESGLENNLQEARRRFVGSYERRPRLGTCTSEEAHRNSILWRTGGQGLPVVGVVRLDLCRVANASVLRRAHCVHVRNHVCVVCHFGLATGAQR